MKTVNVTFLSLALFYLLGCGNDPKKHVEIPSKSGITNVQNAVNPIKIPKTPFLAFDRFTTEEGLSNNNILCLHQDDLGFLWIGTEHGLNRYDGYTFKNYFHRTGDMNSILGNKILELDKDSKGNVWVLTAEGLSMINPNTDTIETFTDSQFQLKVASTPSYTGMVVDQGDKIWLMGSGLTFDIPTKKFQSTPPNLFMVNRQYFFETKEGDILAFCTESTDSPNESIKIGVFRYDKDASDFQLLFDTITVIKNFTFRQAGVDGTGNIWIGDNDGNLTEYNLTTKEISYHELTKGTIYDFYYSNYTNTFWLSKKDGLIRYELDSNNVHQWQRYGKSESNSFSLPTDWVLVSIEDRSGNLWVGTSENGLCRYSPGKQNFKTFQRQAFSPTSLPSNEVKALQYDREGRLWVGTTKGLSLLEDNVANKFTTFLPADTMGQYQLHSSITGIEEDTSTGLLYLAYWGRCPDSFNPNSKQFSSLLTEYPNYGFYLSDIFLRDSILYFSNYGGALLCKYLIPQQKFIDYTWNITPKEIQEQGVLSPLASSVWVGDGLIWLGLTEEGTGLATLDLGTGHALKEISNRQSKETSRVGGTFSVFRVNENDSTKLQNSVANCLFEDSAKRLWIGTAGGLFWLKDKKLGVFVKYGTTEGFPSEAIYSILEDNNGKLWLGTGNGICCFDPSEKKVLVTYNVKDGLPSNQFNSNACAKSKSGEFAFGGNKGFTTFHPDNLLKNEVKPNVVLTSLEVNGEPRNIGIGSIELTRDEKNLTVSFAALDLSNPEKNKYQYFLEGFEKTWCQPTTSHQEKYTNLGHGKYVFRVRGCNNDEIWNNDGLAFVINIKPPLIYQPWFLALGVLFSVSVILWIISHRVRKGKEEKEKISKNILYLEAQTNQAQLNSHFTANVLYAIQGHILKNNTQQAVNELSNLAKLIRRFLDSSVASKMVPKGLSQTGITLEEEIELLKLYIDFEHRQRPDKFDYEIQVDDALEITSVAHEGLG